MVSLGGTVEVEAADVVRLVLQFLKESGLTRSMLALQEETEVSMNTVDSLEAFQADIVAGRWEAVLRQVATLKLPPAKLSALYEQIFLELLELREFDTARSVLRGTLALRVMKQTEPGRFARLEMLLRHADADPRSLYSDGSSKERRRAELAAALLEEVSVVPPSRLVTLLGQALKWQQHTGRLPPGARFDVFRGTAPRRREEEERPPTRTAAVIRFGAKSHAECLLFTPDGTSLITGSVDGFVEVWDPATGKLRTDLKYQQDEELMLHDESVLALAVTRDSELLASGCKEGTIKVWRISTGQCLRKFVRAHEDGVTALAFSRDGTQLLSGGYDGVARVHGLRSGKTLKEFRGHTSFLNMTQFSADGALVLTASSDGTVRVWNAKTADALHVLKPPQANAVTDMALHTALPVPKTADRILVAGRGPRAFLLATTGEVLQTYASGTPSEKGGDILAAALSTQGRWLFLLTEDRRLCTFRVDSGELDCDLELGDAEGIALAVHPFQNLVATAANESVVRVWKP